MENGKMTINPFKPDGKYVGNEYSWAFYTIILIETTECETIIMWENLLCGVWSVECG